MRLLVRSLGHPAPLELDAPTSASVADFEALLRGSSRLGDGPEDRQRLVYCGRVLRDRSVKLSDVCSDGDTLVLLTGREPARRPLHAEPPPRGPTQGDINAAIRQDLARQGPGTLEAAEAAERQQQAQQAQQQQQRAGPEGGPMAQLLEQALLGGEMGALRAYLEQLQDALGEQLAQAGGGAAAAGGAAATAGGAAAGGADGAGLPLAAALDAFFGGLGAAGAGGAAGAAGGVASHEGDGNLESDEEGGEHGHEYDSEGGSEEEESYTEDEEEEGEYTTDEEEEGEEEEEAGEGHQLPPQVPDLDSAALAELMEMGFPEALCRNALLWGRNSLQPALEWLLQHAEDPAAAEPLSDAQLARLFGRGQPRRGVQPDQGHLMHLQDMGFDRQQAEQALRTFNNSLPAAATWLLNAGALAPRQRLQREGSAGPSGQQPQQLQQQPQPEVPSEAGWAANASEHSSGSGGGEGGSVRRRELPQLVSSGGSEDGSSAASEQSQEEEDEEGPPRLTDDGSDGSSEDGGSEVAPPPLRQVAGSDDVDAPPPLVGEVSSSNEGRRQRQQREQRQGEEAGMPELEDASSEEGAEGERAGAGAAPLGPA